LKIDLFNPGSRWITLINSTFFNTIVTSFGVVSLLNLLDKLYLKFFNTIGFYLCEPINPIIGPEP
jgi:hypothetical protein